MARLPRIRAPHAEPATPVDVMSLRRDEFRTLLGLGAPVMAAQMLQMAMGVIDTIMAGRVSAHDLAGLALAQSVLWPSQMLLAGLINAATPIVSQLNGAGRIPEIGPVVRQGLWIALASSLALALFWQNVDFVYVLLGVDEKTRQIAVDYLYYTSFGIPALLCYFMLRYLAEGLGHTLPAMVIAGVALVSKIGLNYVFIYGQFGLPAYGGAGAGISSALLWWLELAAILFVVTRPRFRATGWTDRFDWPDPVALMRFVRIGLPIGATTFAEGFAFSLMTLLLGQFGANAVASHQIAANLNGVTFMLPLGIGMAATIRVGFNVGAQDYLRARAAAEAAILLAICYAIVAGVLLALFRQQIAALYIEDAAVVAIAATVMLFVAAYQLADDTQVVAIGALRGYKDTRAPMLIALFGYWVIGTPISCWLGFGWGLDAPWGVYGFWTGMTIGLSTVALLLARRLWLISRDVARIHALAAT